MRAWDEERDFAELVRADAEIRAHLDAAALAEVFDLDATIANLDSTFDRLRRLVPKEEPASVPEATHVASGKVRELYALDDDRLLLVASDRISTFDVILPTEIPDKGRVLTGLSGFWFARTAARRPEPPARAARRRPLDRVPAPRDAADRVRRPRLPLRLGLEGLPGDRRGLRAPPAGRAASSRSSCREPIFTPATKAQTGHDENIDRAAAVELVGEERFDEVEATALALYALVSEHARERGIILADTKLEFGLDETGALVLGDEAFTPDSSRFWPADEYRPARTPPSFDKQFVRDYCETLGWDKTYPGPELPGRRRRRHARALRRGVRAADRARVRRLPRRPERRARMRATVLVRPKPGILDPQGQAVESSLRHLGFDVGDARVGRLVDVELATDDRAEARAAARADVRAAPDEPPDRELRDRARRERMTEPPADRRRRLPGVERRPRRALALERLGAERAARLAHRDGAAARGRRPSSCRAGSRTATTSAAARSHGSRRSCAPSSRFAADGGLVLGICNGFQILTEAGLLPGALRPNASLSFVCRDVPLVVESADTPFTSRCAPGQALTIPVKHGDGCWFADAELLAELERRRPARAPLRRGREPERRGRRRRGRRERRGQRVRAHAAPGARGRSAARLDRRRAAPRLARRCGSVVGSARSSRPLPRASAARAGVFSSALRSRSRSRARSVTGPRRTTPSVE